MATDWEWCQSRSRNKHTQGSTYAGDAVEKRLTRPLDVEGHPIAKTAHEAYVRVLHVEDHHIPADCAVLGVTLQHLAQLHCSQGVQLGVRVAYLVQMNGRPLENV